MIQTTTTIFSPVGSLNPYINPRRVKCLQSGGSPPFTTVSSAIKKSKQVWRANEGEAHGDVTGPEEDISERGSSQQ